MGAPLPPNESERLSALHDYQILDTPPEAAYERLTSLAARFFETPIAVVSLVDQERQWFKSCFGFAATEVERKYSFCAHAILSNELMVVTDARLDERFADNFQVTGAPYIRFYAGAPLISPEGFNVGTLCIVDTEPREFSEAQKGILADLAAMVMDEMEIRRLARDLREREATLREILQTNSQLAVAVSTLSSGVIITDSTVPDNPIIYANESFCALTGYTPAEILGKNARFMQGPDTDWEVVAQMREAIAAQQHFQCILLNYRRDGSKFLNEIIINPVFDKAGNLTSYVGIEHDVTEREHSRQVLEQRVVERTADLAHSQIEILQRLATAAEFRDDETGRHTQRVARTAQLIGRALGLPETEAELLLQAAPLHDVGKIAVSDAILLKPARLTPEEFEIMKKHTEIGAAILAQGRSEVVKIAERIARSHHERWDGSGYPDGLAGDAIPIEAQILAVADVFDALSHERTYKRAWPVNDAVAEIAKASGTQFNPLVVQAFLTLRHEELV